ncbi:MAG: ATP-binding cassette domain-containing protein [Cyanobacteriota bacterium]|nr:ATP-binding cassette domain-containing protein [Cyanobacteriota bacterium]
MKKLIPAARSEARAVSSVPHRSTILEIQGLSHHFSPSLAGSRAAGPHPVLSSVDLRVASGEIAVLLGPSGCGKSTLLNIASGLVPCQQGRVLVEGELAAGPHPRVGVVFQQPALLPWLTVGKNVAFGLSLRHSEPLSERERLARVEEALAVVGLRVPLTMPTSHLSGGMAQKVALARVLVRRPRLLLLDEPFSALDAVNRAGMQRLLRSIVERLGTGILIVTHDVDEALNLGHRIMLMAGHPGRIQREWHSIAAGNSDRRPQIRGEILHELDAIFHSD